ncbi:hypothetical protein FRC08_009165, partial [Ceratobasidium sp. 394]
MGEQPAAEDLTPSQGPDQQPALKRLRVALDKANADLLSKDQALGAYVRAVAVRNKTIDDLRAGAGLEQPEDDEEQAEPGKEDDRAILDRSEVDVQAVRTAGRRCCALHMPWMCQGDVLFGNDVYTSFKAILSELEVLRGMTDDTEAVAEAENSVAEFWAEARFATADPVNIVHEVVSHLDIELAKQWFEPWFKRQ